MLRKPVLFTLVSFLALALGCAEGDPKVVYRDKQEEKAEPPPLPDDRRLDVSASFAIDGDGFADSSQELVFQDDALSRHASFWGWLPADEGQGQGRTTISLQGVAVEYTVRIFVVTEASAPGRYQFESSADDRGHEGFQIHLQHRVTNERRRYLASRARLSLKVDPDDASYLTGEFEGRFVRTQSRLNSEQERGSAEVSQGRFRIGLAQSRPEAFANWPPSR